jgi:hypothetical protein
VWALLLGITLMSIFPLPFGQGPFHTVNGPATAFRAYRNAVLIFATLATLAALGFRLASDQTPARRSDDSNVLCFLEVLQCGAILRC